MYSPLSFPGLRLISTKERVMEARSGPRSYHVRTTACWEQGLGLLCRQRKSETLSTKAVIQRTHSSKAASKGRQILSRHTQRRRYPAPACNSRYINPKASDTLVLTEPQETSLGFQHHGTEYWIPAPTSQANSPIWKCSGDEDPTCADQQPSPNLVLDLIFNYQGVLLGHTNYLIPSMGACS